MQCFRQESECRRTQADLNDKTIKMAQHRREQALRTGAPGARLAGATAFAAALILAAAPPHAARAQLITGNGPLDISSDRNEFLQHANEAVFHGRVEVLRGENRLHCDNLQVFFRPKRTAPGAQPAAGSPGALDSNSISRIVADGDVYIVSGDQVVRGDTAVYTADTDTIVTTGSEVILKRGDDVAVGTRLVVQRRQGVATLEGGPDSRPRMIVFPKEKPASPPAATP